MRAIALRSLDHAGKRVAKGDVFDLDDAEFEGLLARGMVRAVADEPAPPQAGEPDWHTMPVKELAEFIQRRTGEDAHKLPKARLALEAQRLWRQAPPPPPVAAAAPAKRQAKAEEELPAEPKRARR